MEATACQRLSNPRELRPQWQPFVFTSMGKSLVISKCRITSREMAGNTSVINYPSPPPSAYFVDNPVSQKHCASYLPLPLVKELDTQQSGRIIVPTHASFQEDGKMILCVLPDRMWHWGTHILRTRKGRSCQVGASEMHCFSSLKSIAWSQMSKFSKLVEFFPQGHPVHLRKGVFYLQCPSEVASQFAFSVLSHIPLALAGLCTLLSLLAKPCS